MKAADLAIAALLTALAAPAGAQDAPAVTVSGLRNPVDKSYREMAKGMTLFEELHAMAPGASLRYRLWPRKPDTDMGGIELALVGDSFEVPVPVAADRTFTLGRYAKALAEDASVRPNRRADSMTWRVDIRTPGLPADQRRLGDLRLECRVGMAAGLVSHYPSLLERIMDRVLGAASFCDQREPPYLFFADRPLFSVMLDAGGRRRTLAAGELYAGLVIGRAAEKELDYCDCEALLEQAYYVPLGDRSWPDETRVELEYMDGPPRAAASDASGDETDYNALLGSTKREISAWFGKAAVARFDDGQEIWAYQFGPQGRRLEAPELVVLFDPSGKAAKVRFRGGS